MADTAHAKIDQKLEEMESGCLPFIPPLFGYLHKKLNALKNKKGRD